MRPSVLSTRPDSAAVSTVFADWAELFKARLTTFVLISAFAGFAGASRDFAAAFPSALLAVIFIGLVASGAAALNEWLERDIDGRMDRTKDRPLPSGRMRPTTALLAGALMASLGLFFLALHFGAQPALLAVITLFVYLGIYTPLKRTSAWCVALGAISGALPPLIGATCAAGRIEPFGIFLLLLLALWQLPHFYAIAWMYREEYRDAGFVVLPKRDEFGKRTALLAVLGSAALLALCVESCYLGLLSNWFLALSIVPGILLMGASLDFLAQRSRHNARRLFLMSIIYLPLMLAAAVLLR